MDISYPRFSLISTHIAIVFDEWNTEHCYHTFVQDSDILTWLLACLHQYAWDWCPWYYVAL